MALSILDGTQTATTLSTILSSGQHITAHTVVSLGTQAITDIVNATSAGLTNTQLRANAVTIAGTVTANLDPNASVIASQIETGIASYAADLANNPLPISGTVTVGSALPAGTNRIGVVTIGAGTVTLGAGTAQIGSVTASVSGTVTANIGGIASSVTLPVRLIAERTGGAPTGEDTLLTCNSSGMLLVDAQSAGTSVLGYDGNAFVQVKPVSGSSVTIGNSVTISSLPALVAGTAQIGSVTASISGTVPISISSVTVGNSITIGSLPAISGTVTANTFALQGTAVTTSNFTSTTASTVLAGFNATREVLTIFNEGAGNLHICVGATCTTIAYQVRLLAGDYYEVPNHQTTITHSAVFATAGTARVTQVS